MARRKTRVNLPSRRSASRSVAPRAKGRPKRRSKRRQSHGSAWHWKQTDCWYYTLPGTKRRSPLFDEDGQRIRGKENKRAAQLALARMTLAADLPPTQSSLSVEEWLVARVCSEYIQYVQRGVNAGNLTPGHLRSTLTYLNDFCAYCGRLPTSQLKKGHVQRWVESHATWRSSATHRIVVSTVVAAFNYALENFDVKNPLVGLKKPPPKPRLHSLSSEDEKTLYAATDKCFRDFLFAGLHTGLRPFCELAAMTADEVEETGRGMMWRVYSTKTKKTRKIPVMSAVAKLTNELMKTALRGSGIPLFRNSHGTRWTRVAGVQRYLAIKRKLGWDKDSVRKVYSCYSCRHTFAHRMLSGYWNGGHGCSIETLAELIGDTPKVAFDHYGREWGQHYQEPLWAAIGVVNGRVPIGRHAGSRTRRAKMRRKQ